MNAQLSWLAALFQTASKSTYFFFFFLGSTLVVFPSGGFGVVFLICLGSTVFCVFGFSSANAGIVKENTTSEANSRVSIFLHGGYEPPEDFLQLVTEHGGIQEFPSLRIHR